MGNSSSLALSKCQIHWRPGRVIRLRGYAVISAVAYDGEAGIQPVVATPPMKFVRRAREDYQLYLSGDGLLIASFAEAPASLGWVVTLTLTDLYSQAMKVVETTMAAAGDFAGAVGDTGAVASGLLKAGGVLASALGKITTARVIDTWVGSELDSEDLGHDWSLSFRGNKSRMLLNYDVD